MRTTISSESTRRPSAITNSGRDLSQLTSGGDKSSADPADLEFWFQYWCAAYQFILNHAGGRAVPISYTRLIEQPERSLDCLTRELRLSGDVLVSQADELHPPRTHAVDRDRLSGDLLEKALSIHKHLDELASL